MGFDRDNTCEVVSPSRDIQLMAKLVLLLA